MSTTLVHFEELIHKSKLNLSPVSIETLQINVGKVCNQACRHCHVDASPIRTEQMDEKTVERCLEILRNHPQIKTLDITGGAPELNPYFETLVIEARKAGKHVLVRHNLTVTFDGHPLNKKPMPHLPEFFAKNKLEVIASLPCYTEGNTDEQRGRGVFNKSIDSIRLLNQQGYGKDGSGLELNLVYNPVSAFLPPDQEKLEARYKIELKQQFGIFFNKLFTITNMPIHRFKEDLERSGEYEAYMTKLVNAYNPHAAQNIMCRNLISVSYDGKLYDCDFNQMLEMQIQNGKPLTIFDFNFNKLLARNILFDSHCFGCTAGSGSSCGGSMA